MNKILRISDTFILILLVYVITHTSLLLYYLSKPIEDSRMNETGLIGVFYIIVLFLLTPYTLLFIIYFIRSILQKRKKKSRFHRISFIYTTSIFTLLSLVTFNNRLNIMIVFFIIPLYIFTFIIINDIAHLVCNNKYIK